MDEDNAWVGAINAARSISEVAHIVAAYQARPHHDAESFSLLLKLLRAERCAVAAKRRDDMSNLWRTVAALHEGVRTARRLRDPLDPNNW